jgi:predicted AAA+ superfamily ATPase
MPLLDILRVQNEWWSTGNVPSVLLKEVKRREFDQAIDQIDDERILGIIGPRRTGKTTILYQMIDTILKKVKPERILFFTADDPALLPYKENLFENILRTYYEDVLLEPKRGEKVYIFIDEIHFLNGWELWLKKYYDLKYNIKFIISCSSAIHIQRRSKESLVGRIYEILLLPLSFRDFIALSGKKEISDYYQKFTFDALIKEPDLSLLRFEEGSIILLNKYLLYGGFPEAIFNENIHIWQEKLVSDVLRKVLYRDLAELYNVRIPSKLEELFVNIAANTCETFSYSSLSRNLGISIEAVINYASYLEAAYLVGELRLYSKTTEKSLRSNRKYFIMDCGLRNAVLRTITLSGENTGLLVESVIQKHLYVFADARGMKTSYFREKGEVDIILQSRNTLLPIEVKYQSSISKTDFKSLILFMEKFRTDKGILVTRNLLDRYEVKGKDIRLIPAWLFLMVVS